VKDWNLGGNPREFIERRAAVHTDMWTRAGGKPDITTEYRRSLLNRYILEEHGLTLSTPDHSPSLGCPDIANPIRSLTEHRHEVSLAVQIGDHHRQ
jgi:hypothetical protein